LILPEQLALQFQMVRFPTLDTSFS
jgi:hypothetical protein